MADKKKDKVKVRDLKPNKDAKGGIRSASQKAAQNTSLRQAQSAGPSRSI
jgi:hypothetical protein